MLAAVRDYFSSKRLERIGMAAAESGFVGLIGLVPLILAPYLNAKDPSVGFQADSGRIINLISSGELYLYCFALISTILWLFIQNGKSAHIFFRMLMAGAILIISISSIGVYVQHPALEGPLAKHLINLSIASYAGCIVMYFFLLMCGSAEAPTPVSAMEGDVTRLARDARKAR